MCVTILIDGEEIEAPDGACWCPLDAKVYDAREVDRARAELGRLVWEALERKLLCGGQRYTTVMVE